MGFAGGKWCHQGPVRVMTIGKTGIYAGSYQELRGDFDWKFMLRLMDEGKEYPTLVNLNNKAKNLVPKELVNLANPPIMDVSWSDFGSPLLTKEWWSLLNTTIKDWKTPGNMVIHCVGGHGRTGTALSILAGLNGFHKAEGFIDPVAFVRAKYCHDVVESSEQITYVEEITGIPIKSKGSFVLGYGQTARFNNKYPSFGTSTSEVVAEKITAQSSVFQNNNGSKTIYAGNTVYKENEDGSLEEIGPDDGSYYGPNHKALSSPSILIPEDQVQE